MNFQVTIGFNAEALSTIQELTAAIRAIGAGSPVATAAGKVTQTVKQAEPESAASAEVADDKGPFFWANNSNGQFGKVETKAAYDKLKKKDDAVFRIPESVYKEKQAALQEANETKRQEEIAKKEAAKEQPKAEKKPVADVPVASVEDVIAVFSSYLPKTLDAEERAVRSAFVKPILTRFGAAKATELKEEYRALAINLVQRKMAGEDVDPATAEYAEVGAASEEAEDDLV